MLNLQLFYVGCLLLTVKFVFCTSSSCSFNRGCQTQPYIMAVNKQVQPRLQCTSNTVFAQLDYTVHRPSVRVSKVRVNTDLQNNVWPGNARTEARAQLLWLAMTCQLTRFILLWLTVINAKWVKSVVIQNVRYRTYGDGRTPLRLVCCNFVWRCGMGFTS